MSDSDSEELPVIPLGKIAAVARQAGISRDTLHRFLAGDRVKASTAAAIRKAAHEVLESDSDDEDMSESAELPAWLAFRIGVAMGDLRASIAYQRDTSGQLAERLRAVEAQLERLAPTAAATRTGGVAERSPFGPPEPPTAEDLAAVARAKATRGRRAG